MGERVNELTELTGLTEKKIDKKPHKASTRQPKKRPPDEKEKAIRLSEALGNISEAAEQLGIPKRTVNTWVNEDKATEKPAEVLADRQKWFDDFKRAILQNGSDLAKKMLNELERRITEDPKSISTRDLVIAIGTVYDKSALAAGGSTVNTAIKIELSPEVKAMAK